MRRTVLGLFAVVALSALWLASAGCGGGDGGSGPLDRALAYLPENAPFAAAIDTDLEGDQAKSIEKILERFRFGDELRNSLEDQVSPGEIDFDKDLKPLLGNQLVVGSPDVRSFEAENGFVAAIEAKAPGKLSELLERRDVERKGERNGATLYEDDGRAFAVEDGVLVLAGSETLLDGALGQHDRGGSLTAETLEEATEDLPDDALLRVYTNDEQLLRADPETEDALEIEWVRALRSFGLSDCFKDDRMDVDFQLATDGEDLSEVDLPLAAGSESPAAIEAPGKIGLGLRDPAQVLAFAEAAAQAVDPAGFGDYNAAKGTIERRLRITLEEDLLGQLSGDMSLSVGIDGTFGLRADVKDPAVFDRTLTKLGRILPDIIEKAVGEPIGYSKPKPGQDFYALATADGESLVYGVVDGVFVLANDGDRASRLSGESMKSIDGATGSLTVNADAQQLVSHVVERLGGLGGAIDGSALSEPFGELTGSVSTEPEGIRGRLTLGFD